MSRLVNRKPASRVDCLHSLMKLLNSEFGTETAFSLNDAKYNKAKINIFEYCPLLIRDKNLGLSYCPYKNNPLDVSACGLTNSVDADSTKQKEVSNTINALEGLGFLNQSGRKFSVSYDGKKFAEQSIESLEMVDIFRSGCLRYGPFVGLIAQLSNSSGSSISSDEIFVGYPKTQETTIRNGTVIRLSVESAQDSDVRTKSCLIQWAVAAGFLFDSRGISPRPQITYRDILNADKRSQRKFIVNKELVDQHVLLGNQTERPLDYDNLTKNVASLRENGQSVQRELTLEFDTKVKNRRLAICWALNNSAISGKSLKISDLAKCLATRPELFVISAEDFDRVLVDECVIAFAVGIPFIAEKINQLKPLCTINMDLLCSNAPVEVIKFLKKSL